MWVLWLAIFYGSGGMTMTHQRFETKADCEASFADVQTMMAEHLNLRNGSMHLKHVCSGGASRKQGAE